MRQINALRRSLNNGALLEKNNRASVRDVRKKSIKQEVRKDRFGGKKERSQSICKTGSALPASLTSLAVEPHALLPLPFSIYYKIQCVFMTLSLIAPFRAILAVTIMIINAILAALTNMTLTDSHQAPTPKERILQSLILLFIRLQLFVMGVHFISVDRKNETSRLLVCNHVTCLDSFIMSWIEHVRCIVDTSVMSEPIVRHVMGALQYIDMSKNVCKMGGDPDKGKLIVKEALSEDHPDPIMLFPQGTTSRADVLTAFQNYSFSIHEEYVTPVTIRYNPSSPMTAWLSRHSWWHLYLLCCNFDNSVKVKIGNPVRPSGNFEKFKDKVRGLMAVMLGAAVTEHSFMDYRLLQQVHDSAIKVNNLDNVIVNDWVRYFQLSTPDVFAALKEFTTIDADQSGFIDYTEFCNYFRLNPRRLKSLLMFRSLDDSNSLSLEFDEFLQAFAMSRKSSSLMISLLFSLCDYDGDGEIGTENFRLVFVDEEDVIEWAEMFFKKFGGEKLSRAQFVEQVKVTHAEPGVEYAIQSIFRQNYFVE